MATAYILLNTEIGAEKQVLSAIKKIKGVQEAHCLWGVYDIIANIKANDTDALKVIISKQIGKISKITSKLTMVIAEKSPTQIRGQLVFENPLIV